MQESSFRAQGRVAKCCRFAVKVARHLSHWKPFIAALLALFISTAWAQQSCMEYMPKNGSAPITSLGWYPNKPAACVAYRNWLASLAPTHTYAILATDPTCDIVENGTYHRWPQDYVERSAACLTCPVNSTLVFGACQCNPGFQMNAAQNSCTAVVPDPPSPNMCMRPPAGLTVGNPIFPASAEKYHAETDWVDQGPAPLSFARTYRSNWGLDPTRSSIGLDTAWTHNHSTSLSATPTVAPAIATITSAEGYSRTFSKAAGSSVWSATDSIDTLVQDASGAWTWRRDDDSTTTFSPAGKLQSRVARNGWATTYGYNTAGQLATISNAFGRSLTLTYNGTGQLTGFTTPDSRVFGYGFDAMGRLTSVTYPDSKTRGYVYEDTAFPKALTGIVDESGARYATYTYDSTGRAIRTELAGAADRYEVSYPNATSANVTDPLGTLRSYTYGKTLGKLAVLSGDKPAGDGTGDAASRSQDANGLIASETDFKGATTATAWDATRRLPISVTRASGSPEAQTVTTQWHSTFRLPVLIAEAGRTTGYTYDAQGNRLTETITDTSVTPNQTRTRSWTYTPQGLVATETAPNGGVTTYGYDNAGNRTSVQNALGHTTTYIYDAAGRVTQETLPTGLVTSYTYDLRGRLLTQNRGGLVTTFTYTPSGQVASMTLPSGHAISYTYDAAQRLIGWSDNRGAVGVYTLGAMGNRTVEQIKDTLGNIAWTTARSINSLNRVMGETIGVNQSTSYGYDANGERTSEANGLNQSTSYTLDGLKRVTAITNAANATATLSYNALDAVVSASDFKGVATGYARDALGNAKQTASNDTGTHTAQYDALGLPSQIVDALGQATSIQRDLLGRPTQLTFADGKVTTLRYDLTTDGVLTTMAHGGKGRVSVIVDSSGTTYFFYDSFGRINYKQHAQKTGKYVTVRYQYTTSGLLASRMGAPGESLDYTYDGTGRITALSWNGQPIIGNITWTPLGQPKSWTWVFADAGSTASIPGTRSYDTAGRVTATEFSSYSYDAAGRITSLSQELYKPSDSNPANTSVTAAISNWTAGYDALGRIVSFGDTANQASFTYDANGNRLTSVQTTGSGTASQTITRNYTVDATSNKLLGFTQTTQGSGGTATTSVSYAYNANGDLTSDGLRSYAYDAEGRLAAMTVGQTDESPTTRYAQNALGQRAFKTEPLYPGVQGDENDPGFMQTLINFFKRLWSPQTVAPEKLGFAYGYDEEGTLITEVGTGGPNSIGTILHFWLPTPNGPMPIVTMVNGRPYAVHADHLNTPRRLTQADGKVAWQWAYSAFGDEQPTLGKHRFANPETTPNVGTTTIAAVTFNLRYPGQYFDKESGLHYNYHRSYSPGTGRYTQPDPIGLEGGWNKLAYAENAPTIFTDPEGLRTNLDRYWRWPKGVPTPGVPQPRPVDPTEPYGPVFTPAPQSPTVPDWLKKPILKNDSELEQCKQEADLALERGYAYCKALGGTFNDYRTRKACEENEFRKYTKRLRECEQQCK